MTPFFLRLTIWDHVGCHQMRRSVAERSPELKPSTIWDLHALCIITVSGWLQGPLIHLCPLPYMLWLPNKIFKRFSNRAWNHKQLGAFKKIFFTNSSKYFWSGKTVFSIFTVFTNAIFSQTPFTKICGDWRFCSKRSVLHGISKLGVFVDYSEEKSCKTQ